MSDSVFSRREFMEASTAVAGVIAVGRLLTAHTKAVAADAGRPPTHPLNPLTAMEVERAVSLLRSDKKIGEHVAIRERRSERTDSNGVAGTSHGSTVRQKCFRGPTGDVEESGL